MQTVEQALKEINAYTNNDFKCMENCVKYVQDLYDNSKKQRKRSQYNDELEDLRDENEDTFQMKMLAESYSNVQNDLKAKDNVCTNLEKKIENLTTQINSLTKKNETLSKKLEEDKSQMTKELQMLKNVIIEYEKNLKDKQCAIETIVEKMFAKNVENDALQGKLAQLVVEIDELEKSERQMKEEIKLLNQISSDKHYEFENVVVKYENQLKDKQGAIDTIREKLIKKDKEIDKLDRKLSQSVVELDECKKALNNEKSKSKGPERALSYSLTRK